MSHLWCHAAAVGAGDTTTTEVGRLRPCHTSGIGYRTVKPLLISESVLVAHTAHRSLFLKPLSIKEKVCFTKSVSLTCGYLSSKPTLELYEQHRDWRPTITYTKKRVVLNLFTFRCCQTNYSPSDQSICNCGTRLIFHFRVRVKNDLCH